MEQPEDSNDTSSFVNPPDKDIVEILKNSKTVAVVGISEKKERASYWIAKFLLDQGYNVIPVNPNMKEIFGLETYPSLSAIPRDTPVDIADIFRKSDAVPGIVEEAIWLGVNVVWMQEGVISDEGAKKAKNAGLKVVIDRCIKKEHKRLIQ
jgi:predicted CoA-binding protein